MRASRLVSVILLLQRHEVRTAKELAEDVGVTVRTIHRDIDALQLAGIPIYGQAGHGGGYRLVDGFRTRINGLTQREAEALVMASLPGPAAEIGMGAEIASLALKLESALSPELRERADATAQRFLFDPSGWFHDGDPSPFLVPVADAVFGQRTLRIAYEGWTTSGVRHVEPYGLVLKGGKWYLVALTVGYQDAGAEPFRTYRVSQLSSVHESGTAFTRDPNFNLAKHWAVRIEAFRAGLRQDQATIRISRRGRERLAELGMTQTLAGVEATASATNGSDGWSTATVPIESVTHTVSEFLRLGAELEVLAPPQLRATFAAAATDLVSLYR